MANDTNGDSEVMNICSPLSHTEGTSNSSNDDEDSSMTEIVESKGSCIIFHQRQLRRAKVTCQAQLQMSFNMVMNKEFVLPRDIGCLRVAAATGTLSHTNVQ